MYKIQYTTVSLKFSFLYISNFIQYLQIYTRFPPVHNSLGHLCPHIFKRNLNHEHVTIKSLSVMDFNHIYCCDYSSK